MANLIYAAWRDPSFAVPETALRRVAEALPPEGLAGAPSVGCAGHGGLAVTAPGGAAERSGTSARTGAFAGAWPDWAVPGSPVPEGTFALIRSDATRTELCADAAGSRTLWYACTGTRLVASTSQRALAALLGSLDLNRAAFGWFLSSGSLGPSAAWDRRVRRLPPGGRLVLDHAAWTLTLDEPPPPRFRAELLDPRQAAGALEEALRAALAGYDFGSAPWVLPLSGGYDCRYLLSLLLAQGLRPPTVTWGLAASRHQPGNDAHVAAQLAAHCGLRHDYLLTEPSGEAPEAVADRFLAASGGTTDQLFPYLDGLRLWAALAERGVAGIIRGDEGFGWVPVKTEAHARISVGLARLSDTLAPALAERLAGGDQAVPERLRREPGESLATYRDRLYHGFRIPVGLAALTEVKAPFVEIASPLLTGSVLACVRRMPDALRTEKRLFRQLARAAGPRLPYATSGADDDRNGYLDSAPYARWFREELSAAPEELLPEAFRLRLLAALETGPGLGGSGRSLRAALKRIIPAAWIRAARAELGPPRIPERLFALRASLALRTLRRLREDARLLPVEGGPLDPA